jgi:hypothetical protein
MVFWHNQGKSCFQIPDHAPFIVLFSALQLTHLIGNKTGQWDQLNTDTFCRWITATSQTHEHNFRPHAIAVSLSHHTANSQSACGCRWLGSQERWL